MADFHSVGIFHRDIKPGNIFILKDETSKDKVKPILIDFAFGDTITHSKRYKGTRKYMPKEMLIGDKKSDHYNRTIDVYEIAVTLVEIMIFHMQENDPIDLVLINILEAMLSLNTCTKKGSYTVCDNDEKYFDSFDTLSSIQKYFIIRNKQTCNIK